MIKISNLSKSFSGQTVLDHLDLDIQKGEVVALIGSSGAGNRPFYAVSIILKHLTVALFRLMISQLIFLKSLKKKSLLYAVSCLWFPQFNLFERRTALDNVKEGLVVVKKLV